MCPSKKGGLYPKKNTPPRKPSKYSTAIARLELPKAKDPNYRTRSSTASSQKERVPATIPFPSSMSIRPLFPVIIPLFVTMFKITTYCLLFVDFYYYAILEKIYESICIVVKMDSTH